MHLGHWYDLRKVFVCVVRVCVVSVACVCCMCGLCDVCVLYVCVQIHVHLCVLLRGLHWVSSSAAVHMLFWGTYWYGQTGCQLASGILFYQPPLLWGSQSCSIACLLTGGLRPSNLFLENSKHLPKRSPSLPSLKNKIRQNKAPWSLVLLQVL